MNTTSLIPLCAKKRANYITKARKNKQLELIRLINGGFFKKLTII